VVAVSGDDDGAVIVEVGGMKKRSVIHTHGQRTPSCGYRPIKVPRTDRYRFRYGSLNDAKRQEQADQRNGLIVCCSFKRVQSLSKWWIPENELTTEFEPRSQEVR
jgi:hypothetical protein